MKLVKLQRICLISILMFADGRKSGEIKYYNSPELKHLMDSASGYQSTNVFYIYSNEHQILEDMYRF